MTHTKSLLVIAALAAFLAGCDEATKPAAAPERSPPVEPAPAAPTPPAAKDTAPAPAVTATATATVTVTAAKKAEPAAAAEPAEAAEPNEGPEVGQTIPQYKNTVRRPDAVSTKAEAFDTRAVRKPTVYIVNSTSCPYCTMYIDRMKEIEKTYMAKGVDVIHVYPVREQTVEEKLAHHAKTGFKGGIITDQEALFARDLDVSKTPTVILADAKGTIVYRGRIDDNQKADRVTAHELTDAIDETLAGKPVSVPTTEPFG